MSQLSFLDAMHLPSQLGGSLSPQSQKYESLLPLPNTDPVASWPSSAPQAQGILATSAACWLTLGKPCPLSGLLSPPHLLSSHTCQGYGSRAPQRPRLVAWHMPCGKAFPGPPRGWSLTRPGRLAKAICMDRLKRPGLGQVLGGLPFYRWGV